MPLKESLYDKTETSRDQIKNTGFDYKDKLFEKTMSSFLFRDETRSSIIKKMEVVMYELIERVKTIKIHFDYRKKKNYRKFN